ncbi:MAG: hypothetical protein J0L69_15535 [Bacteroidetes bacterium]|nr:hypothetical protein [Bacteroidota bacterium]
MKYSIKTVKVICITVVCSWITNINAQSVSITDLSEVKYITEKSDTVKIIAKLSTTSVINQIPCEKGWIHFDKRFNPVTFKLSEDKVLSNFQYPKGTWIYLKQEGIVCVFPNETLVQGFKCRGGGGISGVQTAFYKSGKLKTFFSADEVELEGKKCKGGSKKYIELYENGKLKSCN